MLRKLCEEICELLYVLKRKTNRMSGYNTDEVLASAWNDSGSERSSSDSEFEPDSDSGSERDDPVYDSSENIESEDTAATKAALSTTTTTAARFSVARW